MFNHKFCRGFRIFLLVNDCIETFGFYGLWTNSINLTFGYMKSFQTKTHPWQWIIVNDKTLPPVLFSDQVLKCNRSEVHYIWRLHRKHCFYFHGCTWFYLTRINCKRVWAEKNLRNIYEWFSLNVLGWQLVRNESCVFR